MLKRKHISPRHQPFSFSQQYYKKALFVAGVVSFEKGFLKDEVEHVEPAGEPALVVTEAHVAALLQGEQLLHALLHTPGNVLVHIHQPDYVWHPEGERKVLDGPVDREAGCTVLVARLQVLHPDAVSLRTQRPPRAQRAQEKGAGMREV